QNFVIFYATGMVPFVAFQSVSGKVQQAILYSRPLLVYPSVTYIDAILARFLLNFATEILVAYLVFSGIRTIWETRTVVDLPAVALGYAMVAALCFGVGLMNCFLTSMFPLWQKIWGIATRPLMLMSCIFYLFDTIPDTARDILWYNPLIHVVGQVRSGFYTSYDAPYVSPLYVFGLSLVLGTLALIFLGRFHREILTR
ncbi:ABC transporter permease, partial [Salipiger bermudensis]|uniref:ABC transporter permease n=1 Tax=Salipiger bermudensis TaxID=344736 RepID=UPI001CD6BEF7